jgi:hypothetical protein
LGGGLDPGVAALTRDLSELASLAGTELARTSGARAARHLAAHVLGALDIERAALLSPTDEIDRRIAAFLEAMRDIDDLALAALARTKAALSYDWSAWEAEKESFLVEARHALRASVENELARINGASRRKIRNSAREHARAAGGRQVAIWHERAAAEMRRWRESWTARASERANALIDRVAHGAAAAFEIPVARFEPEVLDLDAPPPVFEFFADVIFLDPRAIVVAVRDALSSRPAVARRAAARAAVAADGWLRRNLYDVDQTLVGWLDKLATGLDAALRARLDAARQEVLDAVAAGRRRREHGEMAVKERVEELDRQRTVVLDALAPLSVA